MTSSQQATRRHASIRNQRGVILLLIVLTLLAIGGAVLFTGIAANSQSQAQLSERNRKQDEVLIAAKQALLGYLLNPPSPALQRPGTLPMPDSLANAVYDGNEDSACLGSGTNGLPQSTGTATNKRCLGKLPWKVLGIDVGDAASHDPNGDVPWLAVSANLVTDEFNNCLRVINSDVLALDSPGSAACFNVSGPPYPQPTQLPDPWLTVMDEYGNVLSNRVAAVLILPGAPISTESRTQARSTGSPGNPRDYLDDIKLPLGCSVGCTTYDNAGLSNTFVSIPAGAKYPLDAQMTTLRGQPLQFNDRLAYLTVDEIAPYVERRVNAQMAAALNQLKSLSVFSTNVFPWPAPHNVAPAATTSAINVADTYFGLFPFMTVDSATNGSDYATDFSWTISGLNENMSSTCRRINAFPNRYIKPLTLLSGSIGTNGGSCKWRGGSIVDCKVSASASVVVQTGFTIYSNNTCTSVASGPVQLTVSRSFVSGTDHVLYGACNTAAGQSFVAASSIEPHRWSWTCSDLITAAVSPTSSIGIDVVDTYSNYGGSTFNLLPRTVTNSITIGDPPTGTKTMTVSSMRYHPVMPGWFHENLWYQSSFYALAPTAAPSNSAPCGAGIGLLTVGANGSMQAIALQSGKNLGASTRPTTTITDYFEGQNAIGKGSGAARGMTNCSFSELAAAPIATANDQVGRVAP